MAAPGGALKKFSFSLKNPAGTVAQGDASRHKSPTSGAIQAASKTVIARASPSPTPKPVLGFETADLASEKPKAQTLLGISGGQLEVEGGEKPAAPRVIPCRNPLPLSKYREKLDAGKPSKLNTPKSAQEEESNAPRAHEADQAPVWGLQERKRVKEELPKPPFAGSTAEIKNEGVDVKVKNKPSESSGELSGPGALPDLSKNVKTEPTDFNSRITDEEAAASLIAEARGERISARVVPLLARNSVLAKVRQQYRGELKRSHRQQQQQPGEPDKQLLQRELELLPDALQPGSSAYEAMPVEEFGAAMLRGMGLKSIPEAAPPPKRKAYNRAGLGSEQEINRLKERLEQQKMRELAARKEQKAFIPLKTD